MSTTISVRLVRDVERSADLYLAQTGWNRTALINTALDEWLRSQAHPGIRFVPHPSGRRTAALVGGPEVWTVAESWNQHEGADRTVDNVVLATGLARREIETALNYYADHKDEIDSEIERVHLAQEQARTVWERGQALYG